MALPFQWAAFAFLAYGISKAALVSVAAAQVLGSKSTTLNLPTRQEWMDLRSRCLPLGLNRAMGVAQAYAAPALIGVMIGTAAVGLYDLVTRIPRFLKVVTGVLSSAVLPMVLRMEQSGDSASINRLFRLGLLGVLALVCPIVAWGICFSEAILRVWLSDDYAGLWRWQALMFVWPLMNAVTSFTCGALLGRPHFVSALNRVVGGQVLMQITLSVALVPIFSEQAFVLGQVVALCASLPLQLGLVAKECGFQLVMFRRHLLIVVTFTLVAFAGLGINISSLSDNSWKLLISIAGWLITSAVLVSAAFLTRMELRSLLLMSIRRPTAGR
jgi:O-antigen/teichoic acid export membrane protein